MNSIRSFHVISGPSTLTGTVGSDATHAPVSIWSGTLKRDILQAGGTWPPDGAKTMSARSVTPATSKTKDDSGDLVRLLIASSPASLKKLWRGLRAGTVTRPTRYEQLSTTTRRALRSMNPPSTYRGSALQGMTDQRVEDLRRERRELIWAVADDEQKSNRTHLNNRLLRVNNELYDITHDEIYLL